MGRRARRECQVDWGGAKTARGLQLATAQNTDCDIASVYGRGYQRGHEGCGAHDLAVLSGFQHRHEWERARQSGVLHNQLRGRAAHLPCQIARGYRRIPENRWHWQRLCRIRKWHRVTRLQWNQDSPCRGWNHHVSLPECHPHGWALQARTRVQSQGCSRTCYHPPKIRGVGRHCWSLGSNAGASPTQMGAGRAARLWALGAGARKWCGPATPSI